MGQALFVEWIEIAKRCFRREIVLGFFVFYFFLFTAVFAVGRTTPVTVAGSTSADDAASSSFVFFL